MTREEASFYLANMDRKYMEEDMSEALDMAIKALEQEPCEDAISRQAVIDRINKQREGLEPEIYPQDKIGDRAYRICIDFVERIPSVTPQPKTGMWIEHFDEIGKWYECDQCHTDWGGPVNYCPNCGCKMEVKE